MGMAHTQRCLGHSPLVGTPVLGRLQKEGYAGSSHCLMGLLMLERRGLGPYSVCCYSIALSCPTLCNPRTTDMRLLCPSLSPGVCSNSYPLSLSPLVIPSNHLILYCLLVLLSIFPSIRVFSCESTLCIRWPKYWSFSFSSCPSNVM